MFPRRWYSDKIDARTVPVAESQIPRITRILQKAMAKYPVSVIKQNLESIYLVKSLTFYGLPFGGTFSVAKKRIYITDDPILNPSDDFIENLFHHEFSSILFRKHKRFADMRSWRRINPEDFRYGNGGTEAIRSGNSSMAYDTALHRSGFLNKYSQSSAEEDFEVFSQNIFNGGPVFWQIADKYEKIMKKTRIVISFFNRMDPVYTEEYFRGI